MTLAEIGVRRPVLTVVCSLLLTLFGVVGFRFLGVREYPAVDPPVVTVTTNYAGANPDVIDTQITEPLEQAVNGIAGVRTIASTSREGQSQIRVEFTVDTDVDAAANDVRDKVSQAVRRLPTDADPPWVEKADANAEPIVFMTVESESRSIVEVSHLAETLIKERVQTIPGVSSVRIFGEKRRAMRLRLSADRMAAHGVTPLDVQQAVARNNVDLPAGRLEGASMELGLRAESRLSSQQDFERLLLREEGGRQIVLSDVGAAEVAPENLRTGVKRMGIPMIGVALIPQPNTNAIAIADDFYRRLEQIKREVPPEYTVEIGYDFTTYVRRSVTEVQETLLLAFGLVAAVIYLFLRDWRSTLIPVVAIPVSIISAFFVMYLAGFTINVLTLVGLVLAIGLVCDDAIVVLENVYTKIERGQDPESAAIEGTKEIFFAVVATTVTLAVVFLPIVFMQGLVGRLFREFAVVVVGSVLVSAFVALTLSPMMCKLLLRHQEKPGFVWRITEPLFAGMTRGYELTLRAFLRARWLAVPIVGGLAWVTVQVGRGVPSELAPLEDRSNIRVAARAPEGATYEYTAAALDRLAQVVVDRVPEVSRTFSITALFGGPVNTGIQNVYLTDGHTRARTQEQIFQALSRDLNGFDDLRVFPSQPPTIGSRFAGLPVQYVLQGTSLAALAEVLPKFLEEAGKSPSLRFVDSDLKINRPEGVLTIDRARAAELGVPVVEVARTLDLAFGGRRVGYHVLDGRQYPVIAELDRGDRNDPGDLARLFVRTGGGGASRLIPITDLVRLEERASPAALYRYDRYLSATVSAGLAPGAALGQAIGELDAIAARVLPPGFRTDLTGQSRDFKDSSSTLLFAFVLALVLIYLVLAAQFESFLDPLVILLTVPLSLAGAVLSLHWTGQTLNVFSQIGIIMLIGLVTKNGILIVEFANQRKEQGLSVREAALDASVARLRPILMTAASTILGILPIALALGGAAGSRRSLGIAVVGGMALATVLTLYVVPAAYTLLSRELRRRGQGPARLS